MSCVCRKNQSTGFGVNCTSPAWDNNFSIHIFMFYYSKICLNDDDITKFNPLEWIDKIIRF